MDSLKGYDRWLEEPYQRAQQEPPDEVAELLGREFWMDGERAVVDSWESWVDEDEDGRHGGVDLVVRLGATKVTKHGCTHWTGGQERNMTASDLAEVLAAQADHEPEED